MKAVLALICSFGLFLTGCGSRLLSGQAPTSTIVPTASATVKASATPSPKPTATATFTPTLTSTPSPTPTQTPTPTLALPLGIATPLPDVFPTLSAKNAKEIRRIAFIGWEKEKEGYAASIAIHSNSRIIAAGYDDGSILIIDLDLRQVIRKLEGHKGTVKGLDFSPDGMLLYSGGNKDSTIRVWDVGSWEQVSKVSVAKRVEDLEVSPDGALLAFGTFISGEHGTVEVMNLPDFKKVKSLPVGSWVPDISFSKDGQLLAAAATNDKTVVWKVQDWTVVQSILYSPTSSCGEECGQPESSGYYPWSVSIADTGTAKLIVAYAHTYTISAYDLLSGERLFQIPVVNSPHPIHLANWGDVAVTNANGNILLIDLEKGEIIRTLDQVDECFKGDESYEISPNGQFLILQTVGGLCIYGLQP
jgi:WD40 repeat protein